MNNLLHSIQKQNLVESFINNGLKKGLDKEISKKVLNDIFNESGVTLPPKNTGDKIFRGIFAHDKCYVLLEGLSNLYSQHPNLKVKEMILKDQDGNNAHYLVELTFKEKRYYADAYGIFDNLSEIEARYTTITISDRLYFDLNDDEDPNYQDYRDLNDFAFDVAENYLIDNGEDHDTECVFDRYEEAMQAVALQSITPLHPELEYSAK